ncbi:MAG: 2-hydroxyacid dehydrogenase [Clostridia bacterium]|nr:2-hydroxyacid dehydrogenase [Clostridia bacterium]
MKKIAFFDTKPYDKIWFDKYKEEFGIDIKYFDVKLTSDTAVIARDFDGVCAFVNDRIDELTVNILSALGINIIAMRCAGYNNVDLKAAMDKITVVRVPVYSPYAVAEHAVALLLTLNRKTHRAYIRTKEHNFNISGLEGFDIYGKTVGVIGTGKIGQTFIDVISGFKPNIIAYDPYPVKDKSINYVSLDEIFEKSDIISLHCPLTKETKNIINKDSIRKMKDGVYIINTSRGQLINSEDLLEGILSRKVGGAALDVYDEEEHFFFEDFSQEIIHDETLPRLISMPNVIITSHQAFLTNEALESIAKVTLQNLKDFFDNKEIKNAISYKKQ